MKLLLSIFCGILVSEFVVALVLLPKALQPVELNDGGDEVTVVSRVATPQRVQLRQVMIGGDVDGSPPAAASAALTGALVSTRAPKPPGLRVWDCRGSGARPRCPLLIILGEPSSGTAAVLRLRLIQAVDSSLYLLLCPPFHDGSTPGIPVSWDDGENLRPLWSALQVPNFLGDPGVGPAVVCAANATLRLDVSRDESYEDDDAYMAHVIVKALEAARGRLLTLKDDNGGRLYDGTC